MWSKNIIKMVIVFALASTCLAYGQSRIIERNLKELMEPMPITENPGKKVRDFAVSQAKKFKEVCKVNKIDYLKKFNELARDKDKCMSDKKSSLEKCVADFWARTHVYRMAAYFGQESFHNIQIQKNIYERQILNKLGNFPDSKIIWIHRHGESNLAKLGGQRRDAPLDAQSKKFKANFLVFSKNFINQMEGNIFASPVKRSQQTASLFDTGTYDRGFNSIKTLLAGYEKQQFTSSRTMDHLADHRIECQGKVCGFVEKKITIMIPKENQQSAFLRAILVLDEAAKRTQKGNMAVAFLHGGLIKNFLSLAFNHKKQKVDYSQGFPIVVNYKKQTMRAIGLTRKVDKKDAVVTYHLTTLKPSFLFRYSIDSSLAQSYQDLKSKFRSKYPGVN